MTTRILLCICLALCCGAGRFPVSAQTGQAAPKPKYNVLFIAVDDLNHWVTHLGRNKQVMTPNIDRLAARGVTFANAYTAAPVCKAGAG